MCGIFGYLGKKHDAARVIFEGLKRLEYRGYDSWGIAVLSQGQSGESRPGIIHTSKKVGAIGEAREVSKLPAASVGIGHTRWATHGGVVLKNAHPHASTGGNFVVAQNGIVENFEDLKTVLLKKRFKFETETDTEVIVRLIENKSKKSKKFSDAVRLAFKDLNGRNTIIVLTDDGKIIACRNGSPLVVGTNSQSELLFSSDTLSFANLATKMIVVENGQMVVGDSLGVSMFDIKSGKKVRTRWEKVGVKSDKVGKGIFPHFMIKEVGESPQVIENLTRQSKKPLLVLASQIKKVRNVYTIGSGTTGIAAAQIAYFLRHFAKVNAISLVGADSYECYDLFGRGDLLIAPSQSGETADVLEVIEIAKNRGVKIASNVNMPGSMMTKLSDFRFMTQAGAEICVVSTKVFVAHIAWGYLLSKTVAGKYEEGVRNLESLGKIIKKYLGDEKNIKSIKELVKFLLHEDHIFLLGKAQNFQIIREGMVKLIETSYKHAHAMPAGDLKHYAITMMEKGVPVIVAVSNDQVKSDVLNAVSQVRARGAFVIGISSDHNPEFDFWLKVGDVGEVSSIMNVIPLQLLAYYMAVDLGHNVDRPRNIAKSVTVK